MVRRARKIVWSDEAVRERIQILAYWKMRNKSNIYSKKLDNLIVEKLNLVAQNPYIGKNSRVKDVRTITVRDNVLVYQIFENKILVLSVWEGHQNPENFNY